MKNSKKITEAVFKRLAELAVAEDEDFEVSMNERGDIVITGPLPSAHSVVLKVGQVREPALHDDDSASEATTYTVADVTLPTLRMRESDENEKHSPEFALARRVFELAKKVVMP